MITEIKKLPVTATSTTFLGAAKFLDLEHAGYAEDEYLFSGTANIYGDNGNKHTQVLYADAPYTNRYVVRHPKDPAKASGRVVVEILNSTSYMDLDRFWVLTHQHLMRNGDCYVGITSKPITMKTLRKCDPERYAPLAWNNPRKSLFTSRLLGNMARASYPETEDGLFWDMLTELALKLRKEPELLGGIQAKYLYLAGWSQSGGYMITYLNWFARERYQAGMNSVFDGHFLAGAVPVVAPGLNQSECMDPLEGDTRLQFSSVPCLDMHTESENALLGVHETRIPDSDTDTLKYRFYGVPGSTHDSYTTMRGYFHDDFTEMDKSGFYLLYPGKEPYPNDFGYHFAYQAGLQALYDWTEKGIVPPVTEQIPVLPDKTNGKDSDGNALGGWRTPEIDCPVCTYQQFATPLVPSVTCFLYGCEVPFSQEKLVDRYGSLAQYRALVAETAHQAVQKRLLVLEDLEPCVEFCTAKAVKYGLK